MSQMTDDMARRIIANWEATKYHYGITAWEECQLAYRWLHHGEAIRAAVAAERERIAASWDGCTYDDVGGSVDIGAAIRRGE